jgi:membrane protease YdiL (CAAX protease family)
MEKKKSAAGFQVALIITVLFFIAQEFVFGGAEEFGIGFTAVRVVLGLGGLIAITKLYGIDFKFRGREVGRGIITAGSLIFLAIGIWNFSGTLKTPELGFMQAFPAVIIILFWGMSVGLFEEALCRGVLFNTFRKRMGESRSSIMKSIVFSSLIFGCLHFMNLIDNPHLVVATITQVIYATLIGICLACIYYITDNIWVVSILHGLFDIGAVIMGCFVVSGSRIFSDKDDTILELFQASGIYMIITAVFIILLFIEFEKRGILEEK